MYERHDAHAIGPGEESSNRETAVVQRDKLKGLTSSAEWGMVLAFIEDQSKKRVHEIMTTVAIDEANARKLEFSKGEYNGLQLVKVFVEQQLDTAEDLVELYREQARMENRNVRE